MIDCLEEGIRQRGEKGRLVYLQSSNCGYPVPGGISLRAVEAGDAAGASIHHVFST